MEKLHKGSRLSHYVVYIHVIKHDIDLHSDVEAPRQLVGYA